MTCRCLLGITFLLVACASRPDANDRSAQVCGLLRWPARAARGTREVRLWMDHGLIQPREVVRLTKSGDRFSGEIVRWWDVPADQQRLIEDDVRKCADRRVAGDVQACIRKLSASEARRAYDELDALGVWGPGPAPVIPRETYVIVADGEELAVDLLRGPGARHYRFPVDPAASGYDVRAGRIARWAATLLATP
jgi:hypothetical protein